jgi:hypothetical protein
MVDHTETEDAVAVARGEALRDADQASLTRRAGTNNSRALVDEVLRLIAATEAGTRKRKRVSRVGAFKQVVEGFLGDLLAAKGEGWVFRWDKDPPRRPFRGAREGLKKLGMLEETPAVQRWSPFGVVTERRCRRFRATPQLRGLAAQHGIEPPEARKHFVDRRPIKPLRLRTASKRAANYRQIPGKEMKIGYSDERANALERTVKELNTFLDRFDIRGGQHRGYERIFHCGDRSYFEWNLGGRLYCANYQESYQCLPSEQRRMMTIGGKSVCELDVKASTLTIFQALHGQPIDFAATPDRDPYALSDLDRKIVKVFTIRSFGNCRLLTKWPSDLKKKHGDALPPIGRVRDVVTAAYPLLANLRPDDAEPPIWAILAFLESEAVLGTMVALRAAGVPSLSVHDSLIVPHDNVQVAEATLIEFYKAATGATPRIVTEPLLR